MICALFVGFVFAFDVKKNNSHSSNPPINQKAIDIQVDISKSPATILPTEIVHTLQATEAINSIYPTLEPTPIYIEPKITQINSNTMLVQSRFGYSVVLPRIYKIEDDTQNYAEFRAQAITDNPSGGGGPASTYIIFYLPKKETNVTDVEIWFNQNENQLRHEEYGEKLE